MRGDCIVVRRVDMFLQLMIRTSESPPCQRPGILVNWNKLTTDIEVLALLLLLTIRSVWISGHFSRDTGGMQRERTELTEGQASPARE